MYTTYIYSYFDLHSPVPGEAKAQPAFKKFPASLTVEENAPASFPIKLEKEADAVTWLKDGKPIDSSSSR